MNAPESGSQVVPEWIVFRYEVTRDAWTEVGITRAATAGEAFRKIVVPHAHVHIDQRHIGASFRVLALAESAHIAVDLTLRDLDYVPPVEGATNA